MGKHTQNKQTIMEYLPPHVPSSLRTVGASHVVHSVAVQTLHPLPKVVEQAETKLAGY
jgi:hypothetical protein